MAALVAAKYGIGLPLWERTGRRRYRFAVRDGDPDARVGLNIAKPLSATAEAGGHGIRVRFWMVEHLEYHLPSKT